MHRIKRVAGSISKPVILLLATNRLTRRILNAIYLRLGPRTRSGFHRLFAKIFRQYGVPVQSGVWVVEFLGRELSIPLSRDRMWLDWDTAVSIVGHDIEVKQTYENLLRSASRPTLFFDVGANYGTHSLLLASQDVDVIAFEPNSTCIAEGRRLHSANDVHVRWEHVAIGDRNGTVSLSYPEKDTWVGSIRSDNKRIVEHGDQMTEIVRLAPLDDYSFLAEGKRLLVKIDVEGLEAEVLEGGRHLLTASRPFVIFEANRGSERERVFAILTEYGYAVHELPWTENPASRPLTCQEFVNHHLTNFAALPV